MAITVRNIRNFCRISWDGPEPTSREWEQDGWEMRAYISEDGDADTSYLEEDFNSELRAQYEAGEYVYTGVIVTASKSGIELGYASLWGIESISEADYYSEVAYDLAGEAIESAQATIRKLCGCERAA